jgi:hypothetical protein
MKIQPLECGRKGNLNTFPHSHIFFLWWNALCNCKFCTPARGMVVGSFKGPVPRDFDPRFLYQSTPLGP